MAKDMIKRQGDIPAVIFWPMLILIMAAAAARFYAIMDSGLYFFDTGMYLNYGRILLERYVAAFLQGEGSLWQLLGVWLAFAGQTDRPLWQLMVDARCLLGWTEVWGYIRLLSVVTGIMTLGVTYLLARKLFNSALIALVSVCFLAYLPSHIFYSRIGLPEATTTLLFLAGLYFYLFSGKSAARVILAGVFLLAAFMTNYRLIILPLIMGVVEMYTAFSRADKLDIRRWLWTSGIFVSGIALVSLLSPKYFIITFYWMSHQAELAASHFDWFNLLTYPYILFRLESWPFALLLLGNIYLVFRRRWPLLLPFVLVCLQMAIFSFSADKAARYICMVTPLMAMSMAVLAVTLAGEFRSGFGKGCVIAACLLAVTFGAFKAAGFVGSRSAYEDVIKYVDRNDPGGRMVTTQPMLLNLYVKDRSRVIFAPEMGDPAFLQLPSRGYRYLLLGPQGYVSWTKSGVSFNGELGGFPGFFKTQIAPLKTFPQLNPGMLERFVFEHNQDLASSIDFLSTSDINTADLRLYDIPAGLQILKARASKGAR